MLGKLFSGLKTSEKIEAPLLPPGVRAYAVGDVHGRADLLSRLFELLKADLADGNFETVYLIFLGDYVDRGFQSKEVLDLILSQQWGALQPVFLKGNHEETMLEFLDRAEVGAQWANYGGLETLASYGVNAPVQKSDPEAWADASQALRQRLPEAHLTFLGGLVSHFELGNCYFVHAGIDPQKPLGEQTDAEKLWIRERFTESKRKSEKTIVHGHTAESDPVWNGRRIGVDTGAYMTNILTAACIQDAQVRFIST